MKQCPECRKVYHEESLNFCLDDGAWLLDAGISDEPETAVIATAHAPGEAPTRAIEPGAATLKNPSPETSAAPYTPSTRNSLIAGIFGVLLVTALGVGSYLYYGRDSSKQIESIAVMPFVNESGSADVEYLSDGMTEILIGSLSQLPNLNVKARTSVFRYKGKAFDPRQIGDELKVQAVLTGRVIQRGNNLTLFVELIDAATENVLWKAVYNRSMTDLISLQNEIAHDVSQRLRSKLSESDAKKLTKKSDTANPEAYRLYLQGRFFWNKRRIGDMGKAVGYFQQAIALDPNYALAYAGLADATAQPSDVVPPHEREEKARAAALKSLSLDNDLAEAHTALAHILIRYELDFAGAESELKRAMELDPKWADTYQRYAELCSYVGRHDEAINLSLRGLEFEPFNLPLNVNYGGGLMLARRYDEAIAQLKKSIELDPGFRGAHSVLSTLYSLKGMYSESVEERARALEIDEQHALAAQIRTAFAQSGWEGYLKFEIARFPAADRSSMRSSYYSQAIYLTGLGEKEQAFAMLNKSIEAKENPALVFLKAEPRFDPLRDDPRFNEIVKKWGFPE